MKNNRDFPKGFAVWITGLPGAGKSVTSVALKNLLEKENLLVQILRMDEMRRIVTPEPKYTDEERQLIYNAFSFVAKKLTENGINVIMDATGNKRKYRDLAGKILDNFMIVYLKCPLNIAIQREMKREDTKDAPDEIYEKAMEGKSETVPGIQSDYEEPLNPDIVIESDKVSVQDGAKKICKKIKSKFL